MKSDNEVAQSCPTLCDPIDCSLTGSSIHGIFQASVLEWVAIAFSGGGMGEVKFSGQLYHEFQKLFKKIGFFVSLTLLFPTFCFKRFQIYREIEMYMVNTPTT